MAATVGAAGLIDTDILIDAARGVAAAVAFVAAQRAGGGVHISVISAMELVAGCQNKRDLAAVQQFLQAVVTVPVSSTTSQAASALMETFFLSHGLLIPDALIAATAQEMGATLYTKNIRHFQMIPSLAVVRPYR